MPGPLIPPVAEVDLDLSRYIRPGDGVAYGQATGEPLGLVAALVGQREAIGPIEVFVGNTYNPAIRPEHTDLLRVRSYGAPGSLARLSRANALEILPCSISQLPQLLARRKIACDVVLVHVTPPDADGWCGPGIGLDHVPDCLAHARVVIAEINDQLPAATSPWRIHLDQFTAAVRSSRPPIELTPEAPSETERAIADRVAGLVPDGATVQFGIGRLPDAIARALGDKRGLAVHSGLVTDAYLDLVEAGAIDLARTSSVAGIRGGPRLYDHAVGNTALELRPYSFTHHPDVLAALPKLVAINSALEIDLTGQVAAERVAGVHLGAVGGQVDFLRGAARSEGGVPIVALASTTTDRTRSKIVARLESGVVTTARSDVAWVVTEHGAVDLTGLTLRQRAAALIGIADPAFRDELTAAVADHV